jgi:hypothetical protein
MVHATTLAKRQKIEKKIWQKEMKKKKRRVPTGSKERERDQRGISGWRHVICHSHLIYTS